MRTCIIITMQINIASVKDHPCILQRVQLPGFNHLLLILHLFCFVFFCLSSMNLSHFLSISDALICNIYLRTAICLRCESRTTKKVNTKVMGSLRSPAPQNKIRMGSGRTQPTLLLFTFVPNKRILRPYVLGRDKKTIFFRRRHKIVFVDF